MSTWKMCQVETHYVSLHRHDPCDQVCHTKVQGKRNTLEGATSSTTVSPCQILRHLSARVKACSTPLNLTTIDGRRVKATNAGKNWPKHIASKPEGVCLSFRPACQDLLDTSKHLVLKSYREKQIHCKTQIARGNEAATPTWRWGPHMIYLRTS